RTPPRGTSRAASTSTSGGRPGRPSPVSPHRTSSGSVSMLLTCGPPSGRGRTAYSATGGPRPPSHETGVVRRDDRLRAITHAELGVDAAQVGLHRLTAQEQPTGDLGVREPFGG